MKIITGMHRSGTSMVMRMLSETGADLGDPNTFYEANKWNPDGYFEQLDTLNVNMPLVHGLWGRLAYFKLPSAKTISRRALGLKEQISSFGERYKGKYIKDVRFSLTLPAWLEQNANIDRVVVCLREPYQVAQSVKKRNKIWTNFALKLWYLHNLEILKWSKVVPTHFLLYTNLLNQNKCASELYSAFEFLGHDISFEETERVCQNVIDFNRCSCTATDWKYPEEVQKVWDTLLLRHNAQSV